MTDAVRVGVLASGRGSNFEALLAAADAGQLGARIVCFATDNPDARALQIAAHRGLATRVVDAGARRGRLSESAERQLVAFLQQHDVHLVCLAGFMRIVGGALLDAFPRAILNIHPSLLPSFPGLEAQRQALEHGAKVSGCTVHVVDAGVDCGPIILQEAVAVHEGDTSETLTARILEREHVAYVRAVRLWSAGRLHIDGRRVLVRGQASSENAKNVKNLDNSHAHGT